MQRKRLEIPKEPGFSRATQSIDPSIHKSKGTCNWRLRVLGYLRCTSLKTSNSCFASSQGQPASLRPQQLASTSSRRRQSRNLSATSSYLTHIGSGLKESPVGVDSFVCWCSYNTNASFAAPEPGANSIKPGQTKTVLLSVRTTKLQTVLY